jgi:uncharacterized protein involved in exopolysaccharide biosynthesis
MSTQKQIENEIELYDYFRVIFKRKIIILAVFFLAVAITTAISLTMPKLYYASASIMIMPSKIHVPLLAAELSLSMDKKNKKGKYLDQEPIISLAAHKILLKSNTVLEMIINKLKLTDKLGKPLSPRGLTNSLGVKEAKEADILQLEVKSDEPKITQEIVNTWAKEYVRFSQELILGEVGASGDFIAEQFELSKKNLVQAEKKVKDFKDNYKIGLMRQELEINKEKLNSEKSELANLEITLKTEEDSLRELENAIANQEQFIILSKAITDDALWQKQEKAKDLGDLDKQILRSEEINPIYQNLAKRIVNTKINLNTLKPKSEYLKKSIESTEKIIVELQKEINQREFELVQLMRDVKIYSRTHNQLSTKLEEAQVAKAMQLGEVKIVSFATEPRYPISAKIKQNITIAGILGLGLGIFVAFFQELLSKRHF